jgi:hypothetical protein
MNIHACFWKNWSVMAEFMDNLRVIAKPLNYKLSEIDTELVRRVRNECNQSFKEVFYI